MKNFDTVYSDWDGNKLVGLICVMDDGIMNVYVHYLLVDLDYHGKTIGRNFVGMVKEKYKEYMRIVVVAYDDEMHFYEACGFEKCFSDVHNIVVGIVIKLIFKVFWSNNIKKS